MKSDIKNEHDATRHTNQQPIPPIWLAVIPLLFLVLSLGLCVQIFGDETTGGPAQICLILAGFVAAGILKWRLKIHWALLEEKILASIGFVAQAILILLLVGALIGIWILGGIVPGLMVYGLYVLKPAIYLPATLLICAISSMATGSSWSTAGTLGLALVGIGIALGIPAGMAAGAVISGSYFGDKLSPFSETTNLASSIVGVDLFVHIKHMLYSTLPPFIISLIAFFWMGIQIDAEAYNPQTVQAVQADIQQVFFIHPLLLLPIPVLFYLVYKRIPALPALFIGIMMGVVCALVAQPGAINNLGGGEQDGFAIVSLRAILLSAASGYKMQSGSDAFRLPTGEALVDVLLSRGGMSGMLDTIWLILSAMFFSGIMEGGRLLLALVEGIRHLAKSSAALITATVATAVGMNLIASEQYLAIIISGRMYEDAFKQKGLAPQNLSRALEDGGTLTSPLVPWNTCGAYMATTLGVATIDYLPYAIFNWLGPIVSIILAWTGWSIIRRTPDKSYHTNQDLDI